MEKELKNYLHLYIGCKVLDDQNVIRTLRSVHVHEFATLSYNDVGEEEGVSFDDFKPILRPLSDMSEDERNDYGEIEQGLPANNSFLAYQCRVEAEQTKFLLSKNFDLFGLIESGLAIDKSTILINQ